MESCKYGSDKLTEVEDRGIKVEEKATRAWRKGRQGGGVEGGGVMEQR